MITLCNDGTANSGRLSTTVEDALLGGAHTESIPTPASGRDGEPTVDSVDVPAELLTELAGTYESEELGASWVLRAEDGRLMLDHPSGILTFLAESETLFVAAAGGPQLELAFERYANGEWSFVLAAGRVRNLRFTRVTR